MNELNLLSRTKMKLVLGGNIEIGVIDGEGKNCSSAVCGYRSSFGEYVYGYCGSSINGHQCRCIAADGSSSVPLESCLS